LLQGFFSTTMERAPSASEASPTTPEEPAAPGNASEVPPANGIDPSGGDAAEFGSMAAAPHA